MELCKAENSVLVLIDIQERLIAAIEGNNAAHVINNASRLLQAAKTLNIPVIITEQYAKGLGNTLPTLLDICPTDSPVIHKTSFSACDNDEFNTVLKMTGRNEIILCGMETHVCVLQTAFALLNKQHSVYVVEDAVCSRFEKNKTNGLCRMQNAGAQISNRESVLFEWMRNNAHPNFRDIVKNLIA
jgi:nicotinamidase-related amidase